MSGDDDRTEEAAAYDMAVYGPCEFCGAARCATRTDVHWKLACPVCGRDSGS